MDKSDERLFRKKPVVIEAFQWDFQDRNEWPEWAAEDDRLEETFAILIGIAATRGPPGIAQHPSEWRPQ